jgi:hypothetical protein
MESKWGTGDKRGTKLEFTSWNSITPSLNNLFNSLIAVCLHMIGTGYGLSWYGLAPSFNSKETCSVFQSPSVPLNSASNSLSNSGIVFLSETVVPCWPFPELFLSLRPCSTCDSLMCCESCACPRASCTMQSTSPPCKASWGWVHESTPSCTCWSCWPNGLVSGKGP